jgi:hypothetical protein
MNHILFIGDGVDDNKGEVHFTGVQNDYTLCGYTMDGDFGTAGSYETTNRKVNCFACIRIVTSCKNVKSTEYKKP